MNCNLDYFSKTFGSYFLNCRCFVLPIIAYIILLFTFAALNLKRDISSVGLEHRLDRAGVTGSNPVYPTFLI